VDTEPTAGRRTGRRVVSALSFGLGICRLVVLSALASLALSTIAPAAFGWRPTVVVSGSMSPTIRIGDVVVTSPLHAWDAASLHLGSVVLAADPGHPGAALMHRVVDRNPDGTLVTKGDANASRDSTPMPPDNLRGVARFRVPLIGIPVVRLRDGDPLPMIALTVMVIVLASAKGSPLRSG
jgi:signal peptidase